MNQDQIVNAVVAATRDVFSTMLAMEIGLGEPYTEQAPNVSAGVVAFLGLAGRWSGTGMLSCPPSLACKLASQLLMSDSASDAVNEEVLDAVAEIANMVIGNVKTALEEELGPMGLSIPTVIYGRNFTTRSIGHSKWTVVPFHLDTEIIEVHLCLAPSKDPAPLRIQKDHPAAVLSIE